MSLRMAKQSSGRHVKEYMGAIGLLFGAGSAVRLSLFVFCVVSEKRDRLRVCWPSELAPPSFDLTRVLGVLGLCLDVL